MRLLALLGTMLIAGCTGLQSTDPASPYYAYTTGWTAQLNRALTIPADAATARLQYGGIVPRNSVQEHDPFCIVELETVRDAPQTLRPGRFEVWRVTRSVSTLTAGAGSPFVRVLLVDDNTPSFLYYITEFRLRDPAQPTLRGMRCAWNQLAPGSPMRHLTVDEMQRALGDWITLRPPEVRV
jgi:hypothetical protein